MAKYYPMEVAASPDTITTRPAKVFGFHVETDKTNDVTIVLNDGASGTQVLTHIVTGTDDSYTSPPLGDDDGILFEKGIEVTLAGTASRCVVFYELA